MRLHKVLTPKFLLVLLAILGALVLLHGLLSLSAIKYAEHWYEQQGEQYKLLIDDASLSIMQGKIELHGAEFQFNNEKAKTENLVVNLSWLGLLTKTFIVEDVRLAGSRLYIQQDETGLSILGIHLSRDNAAQATVQNNNTDHQALTADEEVDLGWSFKIQHVDLNNITLDFSDANLTASLNIDNLTLAGVNEDKDIHIKSAFTLDQLVMNEPKIKITKPFSLSLNSRIQNWLNDWQVLGDVVVQDVEVENPWLPAMGFSELIFNGIKLDKDRINLDSIKMSALVIDDGVLALSEYRVENISYSNHLLRTGMHGFRDWQLGLDLDANMNLLALQRDSLDKSDAASISRSDNMGSQSKDKRQSELKVVIEGIEQLPNSESFIEINNQELTPSLNFKLSLSEFMMRNLNNSKDPVSLKAQLNTDEYDALIVDANMLSDANHGSGEIQISEFDLVPLNGLIAKYLGYHAEKGQFNINIAVHVDNGALSGKSDILIRNLELTPDDQETMDRISKQLSMPLQTALMLIKDDDKHIRLNIPLKGNIRDPDFSLSGVTQKLSQTALKAAALQYVQQAIFPYGLMASAVQYIGGQVFAISLEPMVIDDEISEAQEEYLQKLAELMQEKQTLQLHVCPQVTTEQTKKPDWQHSATQQAKLIKRYLVQQGGMVSARIDLCQPVVGDKTQVFLGF